MTPGTSTRAAPRAPAPRTTVAARVLLSFAVTILAFTLTLGVSVLAERRAAADAIELEKGFVPVALKLAQLRAAQATLSTLVDGIPDERNPVSTRLLLETLAGARRSKFAETRTALQGGLAVLGAAPSKGVASDLVKELDAIELGIAGDHAAFESLFAALEQGEKNEVNGALVDLGALEHDAEARIHRMADRVEQTMDQFSEAARTRELRSIALFVVLGILSVGVGAAVSLHTRKVLSPLARVRDRAQAVARGDLTARPVEPTGDEIGELAVAFEYMVAAVESAQAHAVESERLAAIGKMAAHVTHEIRNPLSSIGLNLELLQEELSPEARESVALVKAIAREVERLEVISEDYLRLARLPSPRMEADDVAGAVRDIVTFARPEVERAGCTLALETAKNVPPASFDEGQLRQAVLNLLRNAREAMPGGGPVDVIVRGDGMGVLVEVADRGGGIPDEIRARVFDPFFSTKGEGTGLGLAITRQIVVAHGGSLVCEPREGGGTRFRIVLPLAPARLTTS